MCAKRITEDFLDFFFSLITVKHITAYYMAVGGSSATTTANNISRKMVRTMEEREKSGKEKQKRLSPSVWCVRRPTTSGRVAKANNDSPHEINFQLEMREKVC